MNALGPRGMNMLPPVVKNLLIINGLMFLANLVSIKVTGIDLNTKLGLFYPSSEYFRPYQLISHIFMHGNFMHILFNMFSLWMFGSVLENYWGPKRFFIYYFVTAFGAAALHMGVNAYEIYAMKSAIQAYAQNPNLNDFILFVQDHKGIINSNMYAELNRFFAVWKSEPENMAIAAQSSELLGYLTTIKMNIPVVGASGAVFGLLLAFGMLFPNVPLFLMFIPIPIKAKYFVIFYGLIELYQGVSSNPGDNVAHFAHLGGMLFGFIFIKLWKRNQFNNNF